MSIPPDVTNIVPQLIELTGAGGFAYSLVPSAAILEKDASDDAIKHISDLLLGKDVSNVGKLTVTLVPSIFDKVFGPSPLTIGFAVRSVLATTLFWLILFSARHANWEFVWNDGTEINRRLYEFFVPIWYALDWISLVKARFLIRLTSRSFNLKTLVFFSFIDFSASYLLSFLFAQAIIGLFYHEWFPVNSVSYFLGLNPITDYFSNSGKSLELADVVVPSTLLTSAWTFLVFLSCIFARLLIPIDSLRRFTKWWFRDPEKHPLTAIAKVAAALIIMGALIIKVTAFI